MYLSLKTLHLLSAALLFGTGIGIAYFQFAAYRSKDVAVFASVARLTVIADWAFTVTAVVAQPITGAMLVRMAGIPWDSPWLVASYALYLVAGLFWLPVVWMQMRIARLAATARDRGRPLPDEVHRLMRIWFWCGWPAFAVVLGTYWLMVAKPS